MQEQGGIIGFYRVAFSEASENMSLSPVYV